MASHIFKNEIGLYLMLSEQVVDDCAKEFDMIPRHVRAYIWTYYFNKFISKSPFINVAKTVAFFRQFDNTLPKSSNALSLVIKRIHELGYVDRINDKYVINNETSRGFVNKLSGMLGKRISVFEEMSKDPSIKYHKPKLYRRKSMRRARLKKKYAKNPVGRPPKVIQRYTKKNNPWTKLEQEQNNKNE